MFVMYLTVKRRFIIYLGYALIGNSLARQLAITKKRDGERVQFTDTYFYLTCLPPRGTLAQFVEAIDFIAYVRCVLQVDFGLSPITSRTKIDKKAFSKFEKIFSQSTIANTNVRI